MIYERSLKSLMGASVRITYTDSRARATTRTGTLIFAGPKKLIIHGERTGHRFSIPTPSVMEMKEVR